MVITIKDQDNRFGVRVAALIFNHDMSKIFMQKQKDHDYYMFPGGRLEINEDVKLKYIIENFIKFPNNKKYHEIGFYFVIKIDEQKYNYELEKVYSSLDEENDGSSEFVWISNDELENYKVMPNFMVEKIVKNNFNNNDNIVEHLVYKEY